MVWLLISPSHTFMSTPNIIRHASLDSPLTCSPIYCVHALSVSVPMLIYNILQESLPLLTYLYTNKLCTSTSTFQTPPPPHYPPIHMYIYYRHLPLLFTCSRSHVQWYSLYTTLTSYLALLFTQLYCVHAPVNIPHVHMFIYNICHASLDSLLNLLVYKDFSHVHWY